MIPWILDTETALITQEIAAPAISCMAVCSEFRERLFHWTDYEQALIWLLTNPEVLIVGHTIDYDMAVFCANAPYLIPLIFAAYKANRITCTEIREKLIHIAEGRLRGYARVDGKNVKITYDLDATSQRRLGIKLDKNTWRLRYGELRPLPLDQWPEGAKQYPLNDVRSTAGIFWDQEKHAHWLEDQFRQARSAFWIRMMTVWGICTDEAGIRELAERTGQEYSELAADLRSAGLLRPDTIKKKTGEVVRGSRNIAAAQSRILHAYARQGKPCPRTDPTPAYPEGQPALDEQACIDSGDPVLVKYAKASSLLTVQSKDIPMLLGGIRYPIHSRFDSLKETGRTSSADPNIQNLRRLPGIRECFVPRCLYCGRIHTKKDVERGHCLSCGNCLTVYISSDFGGLELSTQAQACLDILGWSTLAQAINAGKDAHLLIAEDILHRPYDELVLIKDAGAQDDCLLGKIRDACKCAWCLVDNARQIGKVGNFGFPGGLGPETLVFFALASYGVRMTADQAKDLKKIWLRRFPEWRDYFRFVDSTIKQGIPIEQLRSRRFRGDKTYTARCNTLYQGFGADIAKDAGFAITEECYVPSQSPLFGCRMVNFVHDDYILECPEPRAHEAAFRLRDIMLEAGRRWLPDVKLDSKPIVARRMSKKAKQVWKDGRLAPWG